MAAAPKRAASEDRRQYPRVENRGVLRAELLSDAAPVTIHDFSSGGFSVLSPVPLTVGDSLKFRISSRHGTAGVLTATVIYSHRYSRHRHGDEYLTGLAFAGLDDEAQQAIDSLVDDLTSGLSFD